MYRIWYKYWSIDLPAKTGATWPDFENNEPKKKKINNCRLKIVVWYPNKVLNTCAYEYEISHKVIWLIYIDCKSLTSRCHFGEFIIIYYTGGNWFLRIEIPTDERSNKFL